MRAWVLEFSIITEYPGGSFHLQTIDSFWGQALSDLFEA